MPVGSEGSKMKTPITESVKKELNHHTCFKCGGKCHITSMWPNIVLYFHMEIARAWKIKTQWTTSRSWGMMLSCMMVKPYLAPVVEDESWKHTIIFNSYAKVSHVHSSSIVAAFWMEYSWLLLANLVWSRNHLQSIWVLWLVVKRWPFHWSIN